MISDPPKSGARAFGGPVLRQAVRKSGGELLRTGDANQSVGLAELLHILDVYEFLERGERRVFGAVDHSGTGGIPATTVVAGTLTGERIADEAAIDDSP